MTIYEIASSVGVPIHATFFRGVGESYAVPQPHLWQTRQKIARDSTIAPTFKASQVLPNHALGFEIVSVIFAMF